MDGILWPGESGLLAGRGRCGRSTSYPFFSRTRTINCTNSSGSGSATFRASAARRIRILIVRTSSSVYLPVFRGCWSMCVAKRPLNVAFGA